MSAVKKSEQDFVSEGFSPEEYSALNEGADNHVDVEQSGDGQAAETGEKQQPAQQPDQPEKPQMVDVRAVQEARAAARAAEQELARFRAEKAAETARLEERISLINQAIEAQNKPEIKVPSKDEDPLAFYDHQLETVNGKFASLEQELKAVKEAEQAAKTAAAAEAQRASVINRAQAVINVAIQDKPDLQEAFDFALNGVRAEIASMLDSQQVPYDQRQAVGEQIWRNSMANLASRCPADPQQAAEYVLKNARYYGYGYQQQQAATANAGQPAAAAQAQPKTIQERAEQQERHMSLSGIQGGSAPAQLDAKTLLAMSDKQFNDLMKTAAGRKQVDAILGGN